MAKLTNTVERWMEERLAEPELRARVEQRMHELKLEEELLALREEKDLTQAQVARLLGISQPAVAKIEAGASNLKLATLLKYAEALGAQVKIELIRRDRTSRGRRIAARGARAKAAR